MGSVNVRPSAAEKRSHASSRSATRMATWLKGWVLTWSLRFTAPPRLGRSADGNPALGVLEARQIAWIDTADPPPHRPPVDLPRPSAGEVGGDQHGGGSHRFSEPGRDVVGNGAGQQLVACAPIRCGDDQHRNLPLGGMGDADGGSVDDTVDFAR